MPAAGGSNCGASLLKKRSRFHTTASALKSVPSWNFTPLRRWKIHTFLSSGACSHFSARCGTSLTGPVVVRSKPIRPWKIGKPRKRMPSKPLLGMPEVVGMSDAVMAMRRTFSCATAGASAEAARTRARDRHFFMVWLLVSQTMQEPGRRRGLVPGGLPRLEALQVGVVGHAVGADSADLLGDRFRMRRYGVSHQRAHLPDLAAHL